MPSELGGLILVVYFLFFWAVLKLNVQKTKIMVSGPITSWEVDVETVETLADFIFGGSKITVDGDCSHEIKRRLLLGRKVMTNLDSVFREGNGSPLQCSCLENPRDGGAWRAAIYGLAQGRTRLKRLSSSSRQHIKKQRYCFVNKGPSSQGYGFSSSHVWMWELDWRKLSTEELMLLNCGGGEDLRLPWTARTSPS